MTNVKVETILYATDFSESSIPACDYALFLAKLTGAQLHLLHVISELSDQRRSMIHQEFFESFEQSVEEQTVRDMEAFRLKHFQEVPPQGVHITIGMPFQEIVKQAGQINADLIIMGTHGRTGIEHVLLGSTAERVVRHSNVPVLTVRTR